MQRCAPPNAAIWGRNSSGWPPIPCKKTTGGPRSPANNANGTMLKLLLSPHLPPSSSIPARAGRVSGRDPKLAFVSGAANMVECPSMNADPASGPPPHPLPVDTRAFRLCLGRFVTGVTVITALAPDGRPVGMTVNSFNSVSLEPPLVLWSIDRRGSFYAAFARADRFAVNVLGADQKDLSRQFAGIPDDRFDGV